MEWQWILIWVLTGLITGLAIGFAVAYYLQRAKLLPEIIRWQTMYEDLSAKMEQLQTQMDGLKNEADQWKEAAGRLEKENIRLQAEKQQEIGILQQQLESRRQQHLAEIDNWKQRLEELQRQHKENEKQLKESFENLANRILEETGQKFNKHQAEQLQKIIEPFKEQLNAFRQKVEETDKHQYGRLRALEEQIKHLSELNRRMSEEAVNLTKALKGDNKIMGDWGEMTLKRLLELSGLEEGREYKMQESFAADEGQQRYRPDVVVYLPENKVLVIDAKVSLKHYTAYIQSEDEEERKRLLQLHLNSLRNHIRELSRKNYHAIKELEGRTPEFVLMFIPLEPAFALALKADPGLYEEALRSHVVMVTPSTLLATLKVVDSLWKTERQRMNMYEIVRQAGELYDKFVGFTDDLIQMGRKLDEAKRFYEGSMKKLSTGRGNLVKRVENLRKLGVRTRKLLPDDLLKRAEEEPPEQLPE